MPTFYSEFKVPYCIKITLLNLLSNYLSNQSHKIDSIFHHQLLTYHRDIKMAGILIDENPQIIFITTLELRYEIHFLLKICSMGFSYLSNLIWETLLYEELGHKPGCFQNWILNFRNNCVLPLMPDLWCFGPPLLIWVQNSWLLLMGGYSSRAVAINKYILKESPISQLLSADYFRKTKDIA